MGGLARAHAWCAAVCWALATAGTPAWAHAGAEEALRAAQAVVAAHPRDPEAHLQQARALQLAGRTDDALAALDTAQRRGADADTVDALRGAVLLDGDRPRAALRAFDALLARRPEAASIRFAHGRAHLALGELEPAARDFDVALAALRDPQPEQVMARRDVLLALGRPSEALRALDEGMARLGQAVALQLAAVDLELQLERRDAAVARLDALLARAGANPAWLLRRAEILAGGGRVAEARRDYAAVLARLDARGAQRAATAFDDLRRRAAAALHDLPPTEGPCVPSSDFSSP